PTRACPRPPLFLAATPAPPGSVSSPSLFLHPPPAITPPDLRPTESRRRRVRVRPPAWIRRTLSPPPPLLLSISPPEPAPPPAHLVASPSPRLPRRPTPAALPLPRSVPPPEGHPRTVVSQSRRPVLPLLELRSSPLNLGELRLLFPLPPLPLSALWLGRPSC